jgi:hypothetical protein
MYGGCVVDRIVAMPHGTSPGPVAVAA